MDLTGEHRVESTLTRWLKKASLISAAAFVFTVGAVSTSYAGWELTQATSGGPGEVWKYKTEQGNYLAGCNFIDVDGDIYHFDANGNMYANCACEYGCYHGADGAAVNMLQRTEKMDHVIEDIIANNKAVIPEECINKLNVYYMAYYSDYGYMKNVRLTNDGSGWRLSSGVSTYEQSPLVQATIAEIASKAGQNADIKEKVKAAARLIGEKIDYGYTFSGQFDSIHDALSKGKGVCMQYAVLLDRVCEAMGIHAELCMGDAKNQDGWGGHMWLRIDLSQGQGPVHWMYVDPTWYDTCTVTKEPWLDIDYNTYLEHYRMEGEL